MPFLEGVRIGEARHVYSWGDPDEINPDENVCHASSGDVCHVWEGSLQCPPLTCPFCLGKMGGLKNDCFLKTEVDFFDWATWQAGAKRQKKHL